MTRAGGAGGSPSAPAARTADGGRAATIERCTVETDGLNLGRG